MVERKHLHILNVTRSLLFHSNLPKVFRSYVVHLINRLPSPVLKHKSPFEMLFNQPPTLLNLKVFGSLCFSSTLEHNRSKLDPRAKKCIFLSFKFGTKGYIVFDLKCREISISRNVIFYEHTFPYFTHAAETSDSNSHTQNYDASLEFLYDSPPHKISHPPVPQTLDYTQNIHAPASNHDQDPESDSDTAIAAPTPAARRSTRTRKAPDYLKDFL